MRTRTLATAVAAASAGALVLGTAVATSAAATGPSSGWGDARGQRDGVVALVDGTALASGTARHPGRSTKAVTGLDGDRKLIGIDGRVQDGTLYGVGDRGGLYALDAGSGRATSVGRLSVPLDGSAFGVDFNPAANALRVVSDTGQNLRQPFANLGTGAPLAATAVDTPLTTPPTAGTTTGVVAAAYTNNDTDAATGTVLHDLSTTTDQLLLQSPANAGTLAVVGALGVDASGDAGFDIATARRDGRAVANAGFAALTAGGRTALYSVELTTGAATRLGDLPRGTTDIAVPLR